jgi:hypothetical protein
VSELRTIHNVPKALLQGGVGLRNRCVAAKRNDSGKNAEADDSNGVSGAHAIPPKNLPCWLLYLARTAFVRWLFNMTPS